MGQKSTDDLYQLVRALSPAEKRAFRLMSERHARTDGNHYLALFDAIAAQETYDERALKERFAGQAMLNNFSEAKGYLYRSLLRSLRFTKEAATPESELREVLDHLQILFDKGLFEQADRQVRLGLERTRTLNLHAFTAELLRWERRLLQWRAPKNILQAMADLGDAESEALRHLAAEARLRDLHGRVQTILAQQAELVDDAYREEMQRIMALPELQHPPTEAGFHALSSFHRIHAYYHRAVGDGMATISAWEALVATFEAHPAQIKRQMDQYINALVSLIDAQIGQRRMARVPERLEHLAALPGKEPHLMARKYFLEQHLSLRYALAAGHLDQAIAAVPDLEARMARDQKYLLVNLEIVLRYNICALFFLSERYPETQRYINLVLNRPHLPIREDLIDALHLLEIICWYARGQADMLEHLARAHERRLRQRATRHPFGQLAMRFVGKLMHAVNREETKRAVQEMMEIMEEMAGPGSPAGFLELQLWVRARAAGMRPEQVLRADHEAREAAHSA